MTTNEFANLMTSRLEAVLTGEYYNVPINDETLMSMEDYANEYVNIYIDELMESALLISRSLDQLMKFTKLEVNNHDNLLGISKCNEIKDLLLRFHFRYEKDPDIIQTLYKRFKP